MRIAAGLPQALAMFAPAILVVTTCITAGSAAADTDPSRATIVVVGNGSASAAPEYASLKVTVTSLCYDSAREALDANATLASRLVAILQHFATGAKDKVTASGGPSSRQTEIASIDPGRFKTLCTLKWRSTNNLTIQLGAIADLASLQDEILSAVDQTAALDPTKVAQTYAVVDTPSFDLYPETYLKLRAEAQAKAYDDAKLQRDGFGSKCTLGEPRLVSIEPPSFGIVTRAEAMAPVPSAALEPIIPDQIEVTATWRFQWSFLPGAECLVPDRL